MKTEYDRRKDTEKSVKGLLDKIIAGIYLTEGEMHGYELMQRVNKSLGVKFGPSTIYPLLSSMEKKGELTSEWKFGKDNKRPKKVYKPTYKAAENSEGCKLLLSKIGSIIPSDVEMGVIANPAGIEVGTAKKAYKG